MLESLLNKINDYKTRFYKKYDLVYTAYQDSTKEILDKSKTKFEIEKTSLVLKKRYYMLGKYVAKQCLTKGFTDFSSDDKFHKLTSEIKKTAIIHSQMKKRH